MQIQHLSPQVNFRSKSIRRFISIVDWSNQVVNAARILAARSTSKVALENMDVFRETWEKHVRLLTEAVDEITTIEDFLAVSENHILEDINLCIQAMVERNPDRTFVEFERVARRKRRRFVCRSRSNCGSDSRTIRASDRCRCCGNGKIRTGRIHRRRDGKCSCPAWPKYVVQSTVSQRIPTFFV